MEIVPAGVRFLLQARCDGWNRELTREEEEFFDRLCALVLAGQLELGGKTGLDYGRYKILAHEYRDLRLDTRIGMEEWLNFDEFAVPVANAPISLEDATLAPAPENLSGWLEIPLNCSGPILIGGGAPDDVRVADILFALTPALKYADASGTAGCVEWQAVLPASSLRGVLRHAIYDILTSLNFTVESSKKILEDIFGVVSAAAARCGKISISDARLLPGDGGEAFTFVQHVALDRFSAAPIDGALFSEEPFWAENAAATLRIAVRNFEAHEAALLFHALLDLFEGSLAVGSGVNRGNGCLELAGWNENRQEAFAGLRGNMSWNGENILKNGLAGLLDCAACWGAALRERGAL